MHKQLVAGPWVGEFGWELMSWQGLLRKSANEYDEVVVCAREGHEPLYKDFATTFIPHQVKGLKDCWSASEVDMSQVNAMKNYLKSLGGDRMIPTGYTPITGQKFIKYGDRHRGSRMGYRFDVIVHARMPIGKRPYHSWPNSSWNILVDMLKKAGLEVAAIGNEAYIPAGAVDMRGAYLQDVMDALANSRMALGPSSGPMHLASLCGTPHLVWSDNQRYSAIRGTNKERYEQIWNPLQTPCIVIDEFGWQPPVEAIYARVMERLAAWSSNSSTP